MLAGREVPALAASEVQGSGTGNVAAGWGLRERGCSVPSFWPGSADQAAAAEPVCPRLNIARRRHRCLRPGVPLAGTDTGVLLGGERPRAVGPVARVPGPGWVPPAHPRAMQTVGRAVGCCALPAAEPCPPLPAFLTAGRGTVGPRDRAAPGRLRGSQLETTQGSLRLHSPRTQPRPGWGLSPACWGQGSWLSPAAPGRAPAHPVLPPRGCGKHPSRAGSMPRHFPVSHRAQDDDQSLCR